MYENFFVNDAFYRYLSDYREQELESEYGDDLEDMPDDWEEEIHLGKVEKIFELNPRKLAGILLDTYDDALPEDYDRAEDEILKAVTASVDFEKLNSMLPSLYYASGKKAKITKADLL